MRTFPLRLIALTLAAAACAASEATAPDASTPAVDAGASTPGADPNALIGRFTLRLTPSKTTTLVGKVYDGATPSAIQWTDAAIDGACRLQVPRVPYCATPCGGSAVCVADDTCRPYPKAQGVGTVRVSGVKTAAGVASFDLTAIANAYQPTADQELAYPPFSPGDAVTFEAAGGTFVTSFSLRAKGVAPFALTSTTPRLEAGQPIALTWTAQGGDATKIRVKLDVSHHGGTKGMITCEADDTGSLTIPASLVTQLLALGVAGFPTIVVARASTGDAALPVGHVDLLVTSDTEVPVEIPGLVSCTASEQCPSGQTCRTDLSCG